MIWYVEDDASIRDIAIYALNSAGFETKGFEDGLSFWDALKKEKPELIVLDVMLPSLLFWQAADSSVWSWRRICGSLAWM